MPDPRSAAGSDEVSDPSDLSERYGSTSPRQRVIATVLIVVVAVSSVGFVGWTALFHSTPEVQSRMTYFDFPDDRTAVARLTVVRDAPDTIATCVLRAVSEDFAIVGETEITVTTGPTTQAVEVEIPTERRATTVTTDGCTSNGQQRPR
jgi:Domain of unknown function (DUF4307)